MKKEELMNSNGFKITIVLLAAVGIINIFKGGYAFGVWLYGILH